MVWIVPLLVFVAPPQAWRQTLADEVYTIPASDWRYVPVVLKQQPAAIECEFAVLSGGSGVRVALVNGEGLAQWRRGLRHETLASTSFETRGQFRNAVREPGEYAVIVDNSEESRGSARVQLRVSLDFSGREPPRVGLLPPGRRTAVIAISLAVFLALVTYSGRKLLRAWR